MTRICAWCGMVLGIGVGTGSGETHGCCPNCLAKLREEIKARDRQPVIAAEPLQFPVSSFQFQPGGFRWTDLALSW